MKKNVEIITAERKTVDYFCLLIPVQAKKVLFAMSLLKGDQRLGDSNTAEARHIAGFYPGVVSANYAKEIISMLAGEYSKLHPGVLLTKKQADAYGDARYVKLYDAFGLYGLDYIVTALKQGKQYVADPANGIDEKHMLSALRWEERREGVDVDSSNDRHRRKGMQLVGLGDMMEVLLPYSFAIANLYELVTPGIQNVPGTVYPECEDNDEENEMTKADMVALFIDNARLLKDFYGTPKPEAPAGFPKEELYEGSSIHSLAVQGMFKNCEIVLEYVEGVKMYESYQKRIAEVFTEAELRVITEKAETVQEILRLVEEL